MPFFTADIPDAQWESNMAIARLLKDLGYKPSYSQGICESTTCGYGRLDEYGYWEYSLIIGEDE